MTDAVPNIEELLAQSKRSAEEKVAARAGRYDAMSWAERDAEEARMVADPKSADGMSSAYFDLMVWRGMMTRDRVREESEGYRQRMAAEEAAQEALDDCDYLGGSLSYPHPARRCYALASIGPDGGLYVFDTHGQRVLVVEFEDLTGLEVRATDRPGERVTATRIAAVGPFAWAAKKQRREAVLVVHATWGQAYLRTRGLTPTELEAALAPLLAHIRSESSSHTYGVE